MIVRIPEDIYSYEHKVLGNFTARQLVCMILALVIIAPVFIGLFITTGDPNISTIAATIVGLPILFCAVFKKDGQHLEKVIYIRFLEKFRYTRKRKFIMRNLYEIMQENQKEYKAYAELEKQQKGKQGKFACILSLAKKRHLSK